MKITKNFSLQELVPPDVYTTFGSNAIWFIDHRIPYIAQEVRDILGCPVYINTWDFYKNLDFRLVYTESGFVPRYVHREAQFSQHYMGRAIDIKVPSMTVEEVFQAIIAHEPLLMQIGLSCIEDIEATKSWLHLDCRELDHVERDKIKIVRP